MEGKIVTPNQLATHWQRLEIPSNLENTAKCLVFLVNIEEGWYLGVIGLVSLIIELLRPYRETAREQISLGHHCLLQEPMENRPMIRARW